MYIYDAARRLLFYYLQDRVAYPWIREAMTTRRQHKLGKLHD